MFSFLQTDILVYMSISPRLALFYDNPYLEFKLFVKKLLGKGINH